MVNEMRDRLVEIFKKIEYTPFPEMTMKSNLAMQFTDYALYSIVDDLIANNVLAMPCKDGTKVVVIESRTSNGKNLYIFEDRVTHYRICYDVNIMCLENHLGIPHWNWDKVFFGENARERAEQKLKEMRKDNG